MTDEQLQQLQLEIQKKESELAKMNQEIQTDSMSLTQWYTSVMPVLSGSILIFGLIVIIIMYKSVKDIELTPEQILKVFSLPLIITAAVFLIVTGYTEKQISPVTGLLGTIAGYILGKTGNGQTPIKKKSSQEGPQDKGEGKEDSSH